MPTPWFRRILAVPGTLTGLMAVLIVVALTWAAAPFIAVKLLAFYDLRSAVDQLGPFGDIFGAINALFSGCAFAALVAALWLQRTELQLQREELLETRRIFEKQSNTLIKQNFESTFFSMLRLYQEIVNSMELRIGDLPVPHGGKRDQPGRVVKGRDVIKVLYQDFRIALQPSLLSSTEWRGDLLLLTVGIQYERFQLGCESILSHYYRTLYNILKFIARSDVDDKRLYTNLVRAQLNSDELKLLFFNCLSPLGYEKFKPLVEEFTLLESLNSIPFDEVINELTRTLYKPSAFTREPTP